MTDAKYHAGIFDDLAHFSTSFQRRCHRLLAEDVKPSAGESCDYFSMQPVLDRDDDGIRKPSRTSG